MQNKLTQILSSNKNHQLHKAASLPGAEDVWTSSPGLIPAFVACSPSLTSYVSSHHFTYYDRQRFFFLLIFFSS